MQNLRNRNFLTLLNFSEKGMKFLLSLSEDLKRAKYSGIEQQRLRDKNITLIFEKNSTRTRCTFETAAYDQGAHVTYPGPTGTQMGAKETAKDTARVLGGTYDGIGYRGSFRRTIEEVAEYAGVPVWNGLTNEDHPTQVLADFLTAKEVLKKACENIRFTYIDDGHDNMTNALMQGAAIMGMTFHLVCPKKLRPKDELLKTCRSLADKNGGTILVTDNIDQGVKKSDMITTDVRVLMGGPDDAWEERIKLLEPYRVTKELIEKTGSPHTIFEHCLPAFHNAETKIGKQIKEKYGLNETEVTDEVFENDRSVVFQGTENKARTIKAVMVATLGE